MLLSTLELANARETVRSLLDQLQLDAYLFEVEPKDNHWQIQIECGLEDQWQSLVLEMDLEQLKATEDTGQAREELLAVWQQQLRACARTEHETG